MADIDNGLISHTGLVNDGPFIGRQWMKGSSIDNFFIGNRREPSLDGLIKQGYAVTLQVDQFFVTIMRSGFYISLKEDFNENDILFGNKASIGYDYHSIVHALREELQQNGVVVDDILLSSKVGSTFGFISDDYITADERLPKVYDGYINRMYKLINSRAKAGSLRKQEYSLARKLESLGLVKDEYNDLPYRISPTLFGLLGEEYSTTNEVDTFFMTAIRSGFHLSLKEYFNDADIEFARKRSKGSFAEDIFLGKKIFETKKGYYTADQVLLAKKLGATFGRFIEDQGVGQRVLQIKDGYINDWFDTWNPSPSLYNGLEFNDKTIGIKILKNIIGIIKDEPLITNPVDTFFMTVIRSGLYINQKSDFKDSDILVGNKTRVGFLHDPRFSLARFLDDIAKGVLYDPRNVGNKRRFGLKEYENLIGLFYDETPPISIYNGFINEEIIEIIKYMANRILPIDAWKEEDQMNMNNVINKLKNGFIYDGVEKTIEKPYPDVREFPISYDYRM